MRPFVHFGRARTTKRSLSLLVSAAVSSLAATSVSSAQVAMAAETTRAWLAPWQGQHEGFGLSKLPWFCPRPNATVQLDLEPGLYTPRNGYWFSWMSLQGYSGPNAFSRLKKSGFSHITFVSDRVTSMQSFVASTDSFTVVSFSGSADVKDWINDLTFQQVEDNRWGVPGRIHKGFSVALEGEWPTLALEVARQSHHSGLNGGAPKPVYITGHSLGGAMATLTAARLEAMGIPVAGLYTYAAPRVGDDTFVSFLEEKLDGRMFRFDVNEDIIPRLAPVADAADDFARLLPSSLGQSLADTFRDARYRHAGRLFRFDAKGALTGPHSEEAHDERTYWQTLYDRAEGKSLPSKILVNLQAALDHIPAKSYCSFERP